MNFFAMVFSCCVNSCSNTNANVQMHIFPKDQALYDVWVDAIGRADLKEKPMERVRKSYRICTIHFGPEARYVGTRYKSTLKQDAIPSLILSTSRKEEQSTSQVALREELASRSGGSNQALEGTRLVQRGLPGRYNPNQASAAQVEEIVVKSPSLPSRRTVIKLLKRISIRPGLHNEAFTVLTAEAKNIKNPLDKYCFLMFDEISIRPNLQPNYKDGSVEGFEDFGFKKTNKVAERAQVFMLCGINQQWQQPIYYTFASGGAKATNLVKVIKLIVRKCNSIGLKIIATVCDHASTNRAAIHALVKNTHRKNQRSNGKNDEYHFKVDGQVIIPLFDVPHLFRGIGNALLKHNLQFIDCNEIKLVKRRDIYTVCKMNVLPKLTDSRVKAQKINKMDVFRSIEVFSHSVAAAINSLVIAGTILTNEETLTLDKNAADTAVLLKFLDQVFDSLNRNSSNFVAKRAVTKRTSPTEFWKQAIKKLDSFRFIRDEELIVPVCVKYLKTTITNFADLWTTMETLGFESLIPKTFQQEHLDTLFGEIKQRAHDDANLTSTKFTYYYKNLVINWLTSCQSIGISNFEAKKSNGFRTLQLLVSQGLSGKQYTCTEAYCTVDDSFHVPVKAIETKTFTYVAGLVLKKIGNQSCNCKSNIFNSEPLEGLMNKEFLQKNCYRKDVRLKYVNPVFLNKLKYAIGVIKYLLNRNLYKAGIFDYICKTLTRTMSLTDCFHDKALKKHVFKYLIRVYANNYCKQFNEILIVSHQRISKNAPLIFKTAKQIYNRNMKRRKAVQLPIS